jgi:soluble lytic murein transglycosylase-like protein
MNKTLMIGIALIFIDRYLRKRDSETIPQEWYIPSYDYYTFSLVGTPDLAFENSVMSHKVNIMKVGDIFNIEAAVIAGIIAQESEGVANKTNGRYLGLMQFGLAEAKSMGYKGTAASLLNPYTNIYWGTAYLAYCLKYQKTLDRAISGYNSGGVEGHPEFKTAYVNAVTAYSRRFRELLLIEFPGYATVFPKETWLEQPIIA